MLINTTNKLYIDYVRPKDVGKTFDEFPLYLWQSIRRSL